MTFTEIIMTLVAYIAGFLVGMLFIRRYLRR